MLTGFHAPKEGLILSAGTLFVVATPIGNVDDLSPRAVRVLQEVHWIAAEDTRHSRKLLQSVGVETPLLAYHDHNEAQQSERLIERLLSGESGALISDAGTPLISDPGFVFIRACHRHQIAVQVVPGPCAAVSALSASGLPVNHFHFEGFLPASGGARRKRLTELAQLTSTLIFYESPHRVVQTFSDLVAVLGGGREASIGRELTKQFEQTCTGTLEALQALLDTDACPAKGEFVLCVAGGASTPDSESLTVSLDHILQTLLAEYSLKESVYVAERLTQLPKNTIYARAVQLQRS